MPLPIYNPPAPHADPVQAGFPVLNNGQPCGRCLSCPHDWLVICAPVSGVYSAMGGKFRLQRVLAQFRIDPMQQCEWFIPVALGGGPSGIWSLYYGDYRTGGGSVNGWIVRADMSQNHPADIVAFGPHSTTGPIAGAHWTQPAWNCLGPNTLPSIDATSLGFPGSVQAQPLWG